MMKLYEVMEETQFEGAMIECFIVISRRHPTGPMAKEICTQLRARLQTIFTDQPESETPISRFLLASVAHRMLIQGVGAMCLLDVPDADWIVAGRKLEQMFEPYNDHYTTSPIFDLLARFDQVCDLTRATRLDED